MHHIKGMEGWTGGQTGWFNWNPFSRRVNEPGRGDFQEENIACVLHLYFGCWRRTVAVGRWAGLILIALAMG